MACGSTGPHTFTAPDLPLPAAAGLRPEVGELRLYGSYTGAVEPGGKVTRDDGPTAADLARPEWDDIVLSPRHQFAGAVVMRPTDAVTVSTEVSLSHTRLTRPARGQQTRRLSRRTLRAWRPGVRVDAPLTDSRLSLAFLATANLSSMVYRTDQCDERQCGGRRLPVVSGIGGAQAGVSPLRWAHVWTFGGLGYGWNELPLRELLSPRVPDADRDRPGRHPLGMVAFGLDVRGEHLYAGVSSQVFLARRANSRPFHAVTLRIGGQWTVGRWREAD